MIRSAWWLLLSVVFLLATSPRLEAQVRPGGPPGMPPHRQELEQRVMEGLSRIMQERLGLSDEELQSLQAAMSSFRDDRRSLAMAQGSLRYRLRNPALEELSRDEAMDILNELVRLQEEELNLYRREQDALLEVLSPVQLVQFYRIRDEWGQRIQQLRQGRGPGGRGGPPEWPDSVRDGSGWAPRGSELVPLPIR